MDRVTLYSVLSPLLGSNDFQQTARSLTPQTDAVMSNRACPVHRTYEIYRLNILMVCEVTHVALHLHSHDSGAEVKFFRGTPALQAPVFHSLKRFLRDVEWPFRDFSSLTFTYILSFQLTDELSACFPFSQCVLPVNLIFSSDVESCRGTRKALGSQALPQTTPSP